MAVIRWPLYTIMRVSPPVVIIHFSNTNGHLVDCITTKACKEGIQVPDCDVRTTEASRKSVRVVADGAATHVTGNLL